MELQPGTLFNDRYRLIREISRGSFGEVWLAQDERLDLEVAVKVYIALDSRGIEEFKTEYKVAYTLNHPNLLHAHHFDVCGNRPFLVMPFCPSSAVALIGQTDEQTAWRFIRDVTAGLDFLHGQNIVHRDIKPDNILCDAEGHFLITDFGISVKMRSTLRRNSTRKMDTNAAGTIGYMAPELFSSNPDAVMATDIWALGASLYEMITGELPFMGQGGVMQLHGAEVPELKGDFSLALKDTLAACLAKETWDRPTADRLHEFAKAVIGGENPSATWFKTAATKQQWSKSTVKTSRRTVKQNAPKPLPADPNATIVRGTPRSKLSPAEQLAYNLTQQRAELQEQVDLLGAELKTARGSRARKITKELDLLADQIAVIDRKLEGLPKPGSSSTEESENKTSDLKEYEFETPATDRYVAQSQEQPQTDNRVSYRIQISVTARPNESAFASLGNVQMVQRSDGKYAYYYGSYPTYTEAQNACKRLRSSSSYRDAFVVATQGTRRISMEEAARLLNRQQ